MPSKRTSYLLLLPAITMLVIFLLYPMLSTLYQSLFRYSYFKPDDIAFTGLANYAKLFLQQGFQSSLIFTISFTFASVSLEFLLGLSIALIFRRVERGGTLLRTLSILPYMVAPIAAGQIWRLLLNLDYGVVNFVLRSMGLNAVNWIASNNEAFWSVVMTQVWKSMPFVMLILLSGLQSIPRDIYEAAEIDGSSAPNTFAHITLPLLAPSITLALVFETIFKLRVYDLIVTLTGGGPGKVTTSLGMILKQQYFTTYEAGNAGAISGVLIMLGVLFSAIYMSLMPSRRLD